MYVYINTQFSVFVRIPEKKTGEESKGLDCRDGHGPVEIFCYCELGDREPMTAGYSVLCLSES